MSKTKITKTIDYLSDPKKGITAAVLLVLAIVAVAFVWRKVRGLWNGSYSSGSSAVTILGDAAIEAGTGTSITSSLDFAHLWLRLWEATVWTGTNEQEIYDVLGMLNSQADYMKLCNVWAQHWASAGWLAQMDVRSTLPATLKSELSSSELSKARNILLSKGITPDF